MAQTPEIKRPRICHRIIDEAAETITFTFAGGRTVVARLAEVESTAVRQRLNGLSDKIGDTFAGAKGDVDLAYQSAVDAYERLKRGEWNERGAAGESESPTLICEAIARTFGKDLTKVAASWPKLPEAQQKALRARPDVKAVLAEIRAERAKARASAAPASDIDASVFD